jgi:hypothetical protein
MPEPLREQALAALVTRLQTMTGVRPGFGASYPNTVRVERVFLEPQTVTQFPYLCVLETSLNGQGSSLDVEVTAGGMVGVRHDLKILLIGFVGATPTVLAATWRQRLWDDCVRTIFASNTLGGLVRKIEFDRQAEPDSLGRDPVDVFYQPLTIIFDETFTTD